MVGLRNYKIIFFYHTIRIVIIENKRVDYYMVFIVNIKIILIFTLFIIACLHYCV